MVNSRKRNKQQQRQKKKNLRDNSKGSKKLNDGRTT